jgi:hypothetical protein
MASRIPKHALINQRLCDAGNCWSHKKPLIEIELFIAVFLIFKLINIKRKIT